MKKFLIVGLMTSHYIIASSFAGEFQSIQADLDSGMLPVEAARRAHSNDLQSEQVVQQLVNGDVDIVKAVQTVAKEWSSCDDTYASVRKGVQLAPDRADEIVASIATISGCKCNAQSFWSRSRLEQRLRPRVQRALAEISSTCSCASAGIEAAIELVPDKTEDMIDAIIVAKNRADRTVDSLGQVGKLPEKKYWGDSLLKTKDTNLVRNTDVCDGDYNEEDEFNPQDTWSNSNSNTDNSTFAYNRELGYHKLICNNDKDEDEKENKDEDLIITQYIEGDGSNQALELYNGTNKSIDLYSNNYQLEVFFHGYDFPGEVIQLKGLIPPQTTFVISDALASADITEKANQKVTGLVFKGADAVVLKAGFDRSPCECSVSTVASAINGFDSSAGKENKQNISEDKKEFIKRIEQHYENTNIQSTVVDSIGRILANKGDGVQNDFPIVEDMTLRRVVSTCKGDRIEMDDFALNDEWQSYAIDNFLDSGNFDKGDCLASRKDLLLSEYVEGSKDNSMIELFNGTDRPIDFSDEKYFLEIYNDDDADPEEIIYLEGQIDRNGIFVIANSDADKSLTNIANQKTSELDLKNTRAVVLKKVVMPAYQACYADIANWIRGNNLNDIAYILPPDRDPGTGPDPSDDPRDGPDGGELASPN